MKTHNARNRSSRCVSFLFPVSLCHPVLLGHLYAIALWKLFPCIREDKTTFKGDLPDKKWWSQFFQPVYCLPLKNMGTLDMLPQTTDVLTPQAFLRYSLVSCYRWHGSFSVCSGIKFLPCLPFSDQSCMAFVKCYYFAISHFSFSIFPGPSRW